MNRHKMAMNNRGETPVGTGDVFTVYCRAGVKRGS